MNMGRPAMFVGALVFCIGWYLLILDEHSASMYEHVVLNSHGHAKSVGLIVTGSLILILGAIRELHDRLLVRLAAITDLRVQETLSALIDEMRRPLIENNNYQAQILAELKSMGNNKQ